MTQFASLVPIRKFKFATDKPKAKSKATGCENCTLNAVPGVNKIFGTVEGKEIFVWGMSPGAQENKAKKEFIGPSGEFLWTELHRVGIKRDMCDIQNAVRCYPADYDQDRYPSLVSRNPTKEEIHCCSVFTKRAISESKAKLHLVFGEVAQKQVLSSEYRKGKRIFWSDRLNGHVVCLYHPSYFLRMGYRVGSQLKPNNQLIQFRADLDHAASLIDSKGKYGYLEEQMYVGITNKRDAKEAYRELKVLAKAGRRIAVDIEDGVLPEGRSAVLCVGFCGVAGKSYVFCLDHQEGVEITEADRAFNWKVVKLLLSDPEVKKTFHHGSYDVRVLAKKIGLQLNGYDYDTEFGEYFFDANAKAYGLQNIANRRMPEFAGYKEIVAPESFTPEFAAKIPKNSKMSLTKRYAAARKQNALNLAQLPWKKMVLYNGADCDLTKRVEVSTKKSVNMALMHIYMDAGFLMASMEKRGPLFDYTHHDRLLKLYPKRVKKWKRMLQRIAEKEYFNPASTAQAKWLIFEKLGLQMPNDEKQNTQAGTLELMTDQHEAVQLQLNFRRDAKLLSTYLEGFRISADRHEGRLATKWWLTGTGTGRLSSGAGRDTEAKELGLVNLQNVVSDHQLQNMLVSDPQWREVYQTWKANGPFTEQTAKHFEDMDVFLGFDQSQFELRVVAQRSGDRQLISVFERGEDIHATVGHELMKLPIEKLKEEGPERVAVKGMHFGIIYGLKAAGLLAHILAEYNKRKIIIPDYLNLEWVQNLLDSYFRKYRLVKQMIEADHKQAEQIGYVETMFGFKRKLNVEEQKQMGEEWKGAYWKNQAANCVDFQTEALTQRGWLKYNQIKAGDILLTKNADNGKLEWQSATDIRIFPDYVGRLYEFKSKSFSAVTTPDHRWLVNWDGGKSKRARNYCRTSKELSDWGDHAIHRVGNYDGPAESLYSDDWIRLIGWVLTDGGYSNSRHSAKNMVMVYQCKLNRVSEIDDLFKRLGIPYTRNKASDIRTEKVWRISGPYGGWFKATFPKRVLTPQFLSQLPKRQLLILRDTMLAGDGTIGTKTTFVSGRKSGIDMFQMLCVLCGQSATVKYRWMANYKPVSPKLNNIPQTLGCWNANVLNRKFIRLEKKHKRIFDSQRGVWCPVVPNTYFVARRKGFTYITGNTPIQGTAHQLLLIGLIHIVRQPEKYKLLRRACMEVHDAMYFYVKLRDLWQAVGLGTEMLEQDSLKTVREDFGIDWKVPLKVEPKAGFRFGVQVYKLGGKGPKTTAEFLNAWCDANKKIEHELVEEIKKLS